MCEKHDNVSFTGYRLRLYTGSCHPITVLCCLMNAMFSQKPLCNCITVCSQVSGHGRRHSDHHCTENSAFYLSATGSDNATSGFLDFMSEKLRRTLYYTPVVQQYINTTLVSNRFERVVFNQT